MYFTRQLARKLEQNNRIWLRYEDDNDDDSMDDGDRYDSDDGFYYDGVDDDDGFFIVERCIPFFAEGVDKKIEAERDVMVRELMVSIRKMLLDMNFDASRLKLLYPLLFWFPGSVEEEVVLPYYKELADVYKFNWIYNNLTQNPALTACI